jgi:hypothetical protein
MQGRTLFKGERFMYQLKTKSTYTGLLTAVVLVGSLAMTSAQAGKKPQVDICHLDAEEGIFKPISVNRNSLENHIVNHNDQLPHEDPIDGSPTLDEDCLIIFTTHVLARAYIDADPTDGDYNGLVDPDIAILYDTVDDGVAGNGDELYLFEYPTTFTPCPTPATCITGAVVSPLVLVVGTVVPAPPSFVAVEMQTGERAQFQAAPGIVEQFQLLASPGAGLGMIDAHSASGISDDIIIASSGPGFSVTDEVLLNSPSIIGDSTFLEVAIY